MCWYANFVVLIVLSQRLNNIMKNYLNKLKGRKLVIYFKQTVKSFQSHLY